MDVRHYLCSELVTIRSLTGESVVNLEEIWIDGALFECETPFEEGAPVDFRGGRALFSGIVKSVEQHEFGWRVEVALSPLTPWQADQFKPEHMLDVSQIKRD
jgi:hypothetical protein